jgi:hypothetical protein
MRAINHNIGLVMCLMMFFILGVKIVPLVSTIKALETHLENRISFSFDAGPYLFNMLSFRR